MTTSIWIVETMVCHAWKPFKNDKSNNLRFWHIIAFAKFELKWFSLLNCSSHVMLNWFIKPMTEWMNMMWGIGGIVA